MATSIYDLKAAQYKLEKLRKKRTRFEKKHIKDEEVLISDNMEYRLLIAQINWLADKIEDLEKLEAEKKPILKWFIDEPSK
jgi:hypothetical protein